MKRYDLSDLTLILISLVYAICIVFNHQNICSKYDLFYTEDLSVKLKSSLRIIIIVKLGPLMIGMLKRAIN